MKKFYVTFGNNHIPSGNKFYVEIKAKNETEARQKVANAYGEKWAFIYPEEDKEKAIDRFNMHCIATL